MCPTCARASASEIGISVNNAHVGEIFGHFVKVPTNTGTGSTANNTYGLYVSGNATPGATNSFGLCVDRTKSYLGGTATSSGKNTGDVALTVQQPLGGTGDILAVWDYTLVNRRFHVTSTGVVAAQGAFASNEGLSASTTIGAMSNGKAGVRFGNGGSTELRLNNTAGVIEANAKFTAINGLGVGNSAAATTLGTLSKKMEVFDAAGASLGFVPIYTTIS